MQLVRCFAAFVFGIAALAAFALAYAKYPNKSSFAPTSLTFRWSDAVSRCGEDSGRCRAEEILETASSEPLSPRPYALQLANVTDGKEEVAERLLLRDPRSSFARLTLSEQALHRGQIDEFLSLFLPLFLIERSSTTAYADVLAQLSADKGFRLRIAAALESERPFWGASYITALTNSVPVPLSELIKLHKHYPHAQQSFVRRLIGAGQYDMAYLAFIEFQSGGYAEIGKSPIELTVPFNPELVAYPAPAPFNWELNSRGAEFLQDGGVYAFYQGRKNETFMSQMFPLSGGVHTFDIRQSGQASETSGYFRWDLSCAGEQKPIARLEVKSLSAATADYVLDAEIEPGLCSYVTLSLRGVSGSFPQPARIEVSSVRLVPGGAVEEGAR